MLKSLQSSVESEESEWKQKLHKAESDLASTSSERDELARKNAALEESLKVVTQAEEVNNDERE